MLQRLTSDHRHKQGDAQLLVPSTHSWGWLCLLYLGGTRDHHRASSHMLTETVHFQILHLVYPGDSSSKALQRIVDSAALDAYGEARTQALQDGLSLAEAQVSATLLLLSSLPTLPPTF